MATEKKFSGALPAVKKCYAIAVTNLKLIMDLNKNNQAKSQELMKQFNDGLTFAEALKKKIQSDPVKYDVQ